LESKCKGEKKVNNENVRERGRERGGDEYDLLRKEDNYINKVIIH